MAGQKTDTQFFEGLSEAERDKAQAIEAEICMLLADGLKKTEALEFIRTVMEVRATVPEATVEGVFTAALHFGSVCLREKNLLLRGPNTGGKAKRKTGSTLR